MSTNYHTPWVDDSTQFKAAHMNVPLSELDTQITNNLSSNLLALAGYYIICNDNQVVCNDEEVVTNL